MQELIKELNQLSIDDLEKKVQESFLCYVSYLKDDELYNLLTNPRIIIIINKKNLFFNNIYYLNNKLSNKNMIKLMNILSNLFPFSFIENQDKMYKILNRLNEFSNHNDVIINFFKILYNLGISVDNILNHLKENNITLDEKIILLLINNIGTFHIENHLDYFIKQGYALLKMRDNINDINLVNKINKIIDENVDITIAEIVSRNNLSIKDLKNEQIYDFLKIVIDEVLKNENKKYHDIKKLTPGAYSNVYQIGSKVIKIGSKRATFNIHNNKRFIKPIYRKNIYSKNEDKILFCIEITEKVSTNNISKEDVYQVYKELRCDGYIWTDCRVDNVGRLIRDNKIYFEGINSVSKNSTDYLDDNDEVLKAGEIVILDNDYIYTEDEFLKRYGADAFKNLRHDAYFFEKRYKKEKLLKKQRLKH